MTEVPFSVLSNASALYCLYLSHLHLNCRHFDILFLRAHTQIDLSTYLHSHLSCTVHDRNSPRYTALIPSLRGTIVEITGATNSCALNLPNSCFDSIGRVCRYK